MLMTLFLAAATPQPATAALNDEFDAATLAADWRWFHEEGGWPDKVKSLDLGRSTPGALHLEPSHSAWVRDVQAPFLFKPVAGDFDVRARVRVRGRDSELPGGTWSLGGLMARMPNGLTAATWAPHRENWHFVTTGIGFARGAPMTETKATFNSSSSLKLRPFVPGWVELRLVRVGMVLVALARAPGGGWQVRDRWYRMDAGPVMQVGLVAYAGSDAVAPGPDAKMYDNRAVSPAPVDMALEVDWIRFAAPRLARPAGGWEAEVTGANRLADPNLPEAELLALLGD